MVRNGNLLDFCWREAVQSLLLVCDVVAVSVSPGEDSTEEEVREWVSREPKLSLNIYPWPEPKANPDWFVDWIQYARMHTPSDWVIQLDADEILSEKSYDELRKFIETPNRSAVVTRYNFWRDHRHLIPEGQCLGKKVVRVAPQNIFLASDGYHPKGETAAQMSVPTGIEIFHYGFIRKPDAFFQKERLLQNYFFGQYDPRLEKAQAEGGNWMDNPCVSDYSRNPDPYDGHHPAVAHQWLRERGYNL